MIARVTLDLALRQDFDYLIPAEWAEQIEIGTRVKVPFGARQVLGSVTALVESSPHPKLRPILKIIGRHPLLTPRIVQLARWVAEYYCCRFEAALKSVLPEAVRKEEEGWRERLFVRHVPASGATPKLTARQQEVLEAVQEWKEISLQQLLESTGTTAATVRRLEDKGLLQIASRISARDPYANELILPTQPLPLNPEQLRALAEILVAMDRIEDVESERTTDESGRRADILSAGSRGIWPHERRGKDALETGRLGSPPYGGTFLLHGVTGSGKTEVYLQAIAHALEMGKGAIVLVPEISLTPQTVERFKARFNTGPLKTQVAVLHSHLSAGERHDEWHKIRQGRARIAIGARSAVFAPVEPLGLIVVDEEHEHSYKQEEAPRYHARDVAVMRGRFEKAVVVLGSATPSLESFYNATTGKYALLEMLARADAKKLPLVRVIDMRKEVRADKGTPIFSQLLINAMTRRLENREQTMLFLNRRGYASSLQCPKCGYVAGCPNCSVALTYHRRVGRICCHICGHNAAAPAVCPEPTCRNPAIRFAGVGTERVEETLRKLFPQARVERMDSDTMKRKQDYRRILGEFRLGKIDILVGTQMIAKGLHFPNVTLVGIVYADLSLHVPDFRAGERTFQLLTQVSGRAGRGDVEGEVIVQALTPFHPAIQFARRHDFAGFYEQELEFREQLKYPPFSRAALLTLRGRNDEKVKLTFEHFKRDLEKRLSGWKDLTLCGPAPAPLLRAETYYRHQILLRTRQMTKLSQLLAKVVETTKLPDDLKLTVDIDPVSLV